MQITSGEGIKIGRLAPARPGRLKTVGMSRSTRAFTVLVATVAVLAALSACDKPKPRHPPRDPMAVAPPPVATVAAQTQAPISEGLKKRAEMAGFSLDTVGQAPDPFNKQPAVTSAAEPITLQGFGFDPVSRRPARGVDMVIDGKAYGTAYGAGRADVAAYFKTPALTAVGFKTVLPPGLITVGQHSAIVRVVALDGKSYFDGPPIAFEVAFAEPKRH